MDPMLRCRGRWRESVGRRGHLRLLGPLLLAARVTGAAADAGRPGRGRALRPAAGQPGGAAAGVPGAGGLPAAPDPPHVWRDPGPGRLHHRRHRGRRVGPEGAGPT